MQRRYDYRNLKLLKKCLMTTNVQQRPSDLAGIAIESNVCEKFALQCNNKQ